MLTAGRALLADRDFDGLSIADLAGAIGLSVGWFYGRFRDKEAFFAQLQEQVMAEWLSTARTALSAIALVRPEPGKLVQAVCTVFLDCLRRDRGFVRAALKHESHPSGQLDASAPHRRGFRARSGWAAGPAPCASAPPVRSARVRFAMQLVYGVGLNAVLNDPGPLHLDDRRFDRELARAMLGYLELNGASGPASGR
jgi:AcrR family transcriptional regulator